MNSSDQTQTSRRQFLKTSTRATVGGIIAAPAILGTKSSAASPGDTLRVGLIGCGGRGTGAAENALVADKNTVVTAMGDLFEERLNRSHDVLSKNKKAGKRFEVPSKNRFVGLNAYQEVIESGVDVVLLATPPGFRPLHMRAGVEAGKHMFVEKPMATDAFGFRSIVESTKIAKQRGLGVCAGFCWRYHAPLRAAFEKVQAGDIGEVRAIYGTYNTGFLWYRNPRPGASELEKQLVNWYYYTWLSGDHYMEQAVHVVDWISWAMKDTPPVKCIAHGGRQVRTDPKYGNIFDHFEVVYEYANGARGFCFARQQAGAANGNSATIYGTKGTMHILGFTRPYAYMEDEKGARVWRWRNQPVNNMYVEEHVDFFNSLRKGEPINHGDRMATSTMVGLLGRMAAYTGKHLTYEQASESQEKLVPDNLTWETPAPEVKIAMPGQTQFI